jgi:hypothetical protein
VVLSEILVALGILFILFLILAPLFYFFNREKEDEAEAEGNETGAEESLTDEDQ